MLATANPAPRTTIKIRLNFTNRFISFSGQPSEISGDPLPPVFPNSISRTADQQSPLARSRGLRARSPSDPRRQRVPPAPARAPLDPTRPVLPLFLAWAKPVVPFQRRPKSRSPGVWSMTEETLCEREETRF